MAPPIPTSFLPPGLRGLASFISAPHLEPSRVLPPRGRAASGADLVVPDVEPPVADQWLYPSKFPQPVQRVLRKAKVVEEVDGCLQVRTAAQARILMSALAVHAEAEMPVALARTLDAPGSADLANVAAPRPRSATQPAMVVSLPLLSGAVGTSAERLVAFRANDMNARLRERYLESIDEYLVRVTNPEDPAATSRVLAEKLERDIGLAGQGMVRRLHSAGATDLALTTVSTVVPFPSLEGVADFVGIGAAVASLGLAAGTSVVKYRASRDLAYLRAAHRADVLA